MKYSIIILLEIEEMHKDSARFIHNIHDVFSYRHEPYEILIICNAIGGFLKNELKELLRLNNNIKAFEFSTKTTQATCINTGVKESSGDIIVVCGSYQQITNDSLVKLLDHLDDETDIISPWRQHRVDNRFNQFQSKVFNTLVKTITRTNFQDLSCTVKIFRRKVLEETKIYGNMYRFLPILAVRKGFKAQEVKCEHYQQLGIGKSGLYSISHYITLFIDILTLYFNTRFTRKPLRFFSSIGLGFLLTGLLMTSYVFVQRFLIGHPIGNRPALLLAIFFMALGVQTASVGLLGEIIAFTHGRHRKEYTIEKTI